MCEITFVDPELKLEVGWVLAIADFNTKSRHELSEAINKLARCETARLYKTMVRFGAELVAAAEALEATRKKEVKYTRMCMDIAGDLTTMADNLKGASLETLVQSGPGWKLKREQLKMVIANTTDQWKAENQGLLEKCAKGIKHFTDQMMEKNFKGIFEFTALVNSCIGDAAELPQTDWQTILNVLQDTKMKRTMKNLMDVDLGNFDDEGDEFETSRTALWVLCYSPLVSKQATHTPKHTPTGALGK